MLINVMFKHETETVRRSNAFRVRLYADKDRHATPYVTPLQRQMAGSRMNVHLQRIWKEAVVI